MYTQITCPQCGTPYQAEIHQLIDVGQQPDLKMKLLNGMLNVAVCPNCGAGGQLSAPLIYHDPAHDLFMSFIPPEMNLSQVDREQIIGRLTREVMENTPPEQRKAYLFQPQTILTFQTFMEKVLETEGVTKEMIQRQQKQAELLQTLAQADGDVVDYLLKERANEIDETFFAMLQNFVDSAMQMDDNERLLPLLNLRAKLMTETEIGREMEQRQVALHGFSQAAKKAGGLSPELLLEHVLKHQNEPKIVETLVMTGQQALSYQFFQLLTKEIEDQQGDDEAVQRLTALRSNLLDVQAALREQSQQLQTELEQTLQEILTAPERERAIVEMIQQQRVDDMFMQYLSARIAQADRQGETAEAQGLNALYEAIVQQVESVLPPGIQLLNDLLQADSALTERQIMDNHNDLLTDEFVELIDMVMARSAGQDAELNGRLQQLKEKVAARL